MLLLVWRTHISKTVGKFSYFSRAVTVKENVRSRI